MSSASDFLKWCNVFDVKYGGTPGTGVTNVGTGTGLTGGPITTTGVISLATVPGKTLLANNTEGFIAPTPITLSDFFDGVFGSDQGSVLYRSDTYWTALLPAPSAGYFLRSGGPSADVTWGTADAFNAFYTLYFGPGGNDTTGDGTLSFPFETADKAVTVAQALIVGGAPFVLVYGLGVGVDVSNINITESGIYLYAPGIQFNPVTGDAFTIDLSGKPSASYINILIASSSVESGAKVMNLIGTTAGPKNVTRFTLLGESEGDVYLNVACEYYTTVISGFLTANQPGTNVVTQYGVGGQSQATRLNLEGMLFGGGSGAIHGVMQATNAWRYPMRQRVFLSGNITLNSSNSGYLFINTTTNNYTITLPDTAGQDTAFVLGYEITCLNMSTGSISFVADGIATLTGSTVLNQVAQRINVTLVNADSWESDIPASIFNLDNVVYVAANGNNNFSGTNVNYPISSPQLAVDILDATPDHSGVIKFLDAATYNTQLNIPGRGVIYFDGPAANIEFDDPILSAVNVPDTGVNNITLFNLAGINNYGGGKIFNVAGVNSNVFLYSQVCQGSIYNEGGFVGKLVALLGSSVEIVSGAQCAFSIINDIFVNAIVDGDLYIDSPICNSSTFTVNPGGRLFTDIKNPQASSITNAGGTVQGNFGDTIYGDQIFDGTITTKGILLDVTSGPPAAGYVMTYDGVSTISLQPPTGGGGLLPWNDVTTGTQALAVNNGYSTNNGASLVTYTLPITAAFGTVISIAGFSSGGWTIAQNAGQSIVYGNVQTTMGVGGSLSSTVAADQVSLFCAVADTTWVVTSVLGNLNYV